MSVQLARQNNLKTVRILVVVPSKHHEFRDGFSSGGTGWQAIFALTIEPKAEASKPGVQRLGVVLAGVHPGDGGVEYRDTAALIVVTCACCWRIRL